jgi:hypothetical protein
MTVYTIAGKTAAEGSALPVEIGGAELFVICRANEVPGLLDIFGWDESAILECIRTLTKLSAIQVMTAMTLQA